MPSIEYAVEATFADLLNPSGERRGGHTAPIFSEADLPRKDGEGELDHFSAGWTETLSRGIFPWSGRRRGGVRLSSATP
ncbi:MAG: hypothetical protein BLITH_1130 [Brockia lithotrophica]|uniref:Uncharacterized protein n=1 Tax=Brockia lithotrophica TaxID=933949 RepID=A0A2T5G7J7_9BACL|nr:MAG: hypothetical protein BLITH_1130 [Brockia lithotrophica]